MAELKLHMLVIFWLLSFGFASANDYNFAYCEFDGNSIILLCSNTTNSSDIASQIWESYYVRCSYGQIWKDLSDINETKYIDCDFNKFPNSLSNRFANIESIILADNQIRNISSVDFFGLAKLTSLNLRGNRLAVIPSRAFLMLWHLERLDVSHNQIEELGSSMFIEMNALKWLDLSFNNISTLKADALLHLNRLECLNISNVGLKTVESDAFASLEKLIVLNLSGNKLVTIEFSSKFHKMTTLYLHDNLLMELSVDFLDSFPALSILEVPDILRGREDLQRFQQPGDKTEIMVIEDDNDMTVNDGRPTTSQRPGKFPLVNKESLEFGMIEDRLSEMFAKEAETKEAINDLKELFERNSYSGLSYKEDEFESQLVVTLWITFLLVLMMVVRLLYCLYVNRQKLFGSCWRKIAPAAEKKATLGQLMKHVSANVPSSPAYLPITRAIYEKENNIRCV